MENYFEIFDKPVGEHYTKIVELSDYHIGQITDAALSDQEIESHAEEILKIHFVYPTLEIGETVKSKRVMEISRKQAEQLFPDDGFSDINSAEVVTELSYEISYTGAEDAFHYTVNFEKRKIRGKITQDSAMQLQGTILLVFYVRGINIDLTGPMIKARQEELITAIQANYNDVVLYFENLKEAFRESVIDRIRLKVIANNKHAQELNKF